jgi:D-hydroxyproline dehydrogenase subunit gamma
MRRVRSGHTGGGASDTVALQIDGVRVVVPDGITVAAALVRANIWSFGRNPATNHLRGPYCGMGICFECEVIVDGVQHIRACLAHVRPGMEVATQVLESNDFTP